MEDIIWSIAPFVIIIGNIIQFASVVALIFIPIILWKIHGSLKKIIAQGSVTDRKEVPQEQTDQQVDT